MAATSWCLSSVAPPLAHPPPSAKALAYEGQRSGGSRIGAGGGRRVVSLRRASRRARSGVVCMAPDEERMTRRSPLDFPVEWERPRRARRPDIFPKFSPMKTPLPHPLPADPPEEDEEEEEERKKEEDPDPEKEEEEEEAEKERDPNNPKFRMQQRE